MPGRSTFTATGLPACSPVLIFAKCTCAIEALATGTRSKSSNRTSIGAPSDFSMIDTATAESNGGTRSWSFASSSAISTGNRSRRVDSTWPNFTKIGPRLSSASLSRMPRSMLKLRPNVVMRMRKRTRRSSMPLITSSSSPKRTIVKKS